MTPRKIVSGGASRSPAFLKASPNAKIPEPTLPLNRCIMVSRYLQLSNRPLVRSTYSPLRDEFAGKFAGKQRDASVHTHMRVYIRAVCIPICMYANRIRVNANPVATKINYEYKKKREYEHSACYCIERAKRRSISQPAKPTGTLEVCQSSASFNSSHRFVKFISIRLV